LYSLPQSYNQTSKCKRCICPNAYIELSVKQADLDQFRLVKNGYIQEETEFLKKHVAEQLAMIKAHEQRICEVCKQGEGIWLSDFWLKVWIAVQIVVYGVIALYLMVKS